VTDKSGIEFILRDINQGFHASCIDKYAAELAMREQLIDGFE
jgi:hypothetical protein